MLTSASQPEMDDPHAGEPGKRHQSHSPALEAPLRSGAPFKARASPLGREARAASCQLQSHSSFEWEAASGSKRGRRDSAFEVMPVKEVRVLGLKVWVACLGPVNEGFHVKKWVEE